MDLLSEFARIDLGIACVIKSVVQDDLDSGKLVELPLSLAIPPRRIGLAVLKNAAKTTALNKFIEKLMLEEQ